VLSLHPPLSPTAVYALALSASFYCAVDADEAPIPVRDAVICSAAPAAAATTTSLRLSASRGLSTPTVDWSRVFGPLCWLVVHASTAAADMVRMAETEWRPFALLAPPEPSAEVAAATFPLATTRTRGGGSGAAKAGPSVAGAPPSASPELPPPTAAASAARVRSEAFACLRTAVVAAVDALTLAAGRLPPRPGAVPRRGSGLGRRIRPPIVPSTREGTASPTEGESGGVPATEAISRILTTTTSPST
jgi:hypothetical protein